jgi:hypothetical protein
MHRSLLVLIGLTLAGCGDPENDVLAPGTKAVIATDGGFTLVRNEYGSRAGSLSAGTRVTIGHDPGFLQETAEDVEDNAKFALSLEDDEAKGKAKADEIRKKGPRRVEKGEPGAIFRWVQVMVDSSRRAGESVKVMRKDLRRID